MYEEAVSRIAAYSFRKSSLANEDKEVCIYGMNLILSTIINYLIIFGIGIMFGKFLETLAFMTTYSSIRSQAGGFHAKTKENCLLLFVLGFVVMLVSIQYILKVPLYCMAGLLLFSNLVIWILSPIEPVGFLIGPITRKKMRKRACIISFVFSVLGYALYLLKIEWALYNIMAIITISIVLILGKINLFIAKERSI